MAGTDGESLPFVIRDMTAVEARAVAAWPYEGEYALYDAAADADDLVELLDTGEWVRRYFSADDDALVGFVVPRPPRGHRVDRLGPTARPDG